MPSVQDKVPRGKLLWIQEARPLGLLKDAGDMVTGRVGGRTHTGQGCNFVMSFPPREVKSKTEEKDAQREHGRSGPATLEPGGPAGVLQLGPAMPAAPACITPEPTAAHVNARDSLLDSDVSGSPQGLRPLSKTAH